MKLKEIPTNTVVHTPTEAEAKELLAILYENGWKTAACTDGVVENARGIQIESETDWSWWKKIENARKENVTILTLAEFKRLYCEPEKPQLKFNKGDMVVYNGKPYLVEAVTNMGGYYLYSIDTEECDHLAALPASDLEPYTEPKTKTTEDMETKEKEPGEKGNNSENSQLDLCELLKGHNGEKFYSLAHGEVTLDHVSPTIDSCIVVKKRNGGKERFYRNGRWLRDGVVMLFPSRALYEQYPLDPYTAWMKWQEKQKKWELRIGDLFFHSPEARDKATEEIKAIIEKYCK